MQKQKCLINTQKPQKMMMPRNAKNCRKPRARNPVESPTPLGVPFNVERVQSATL